jgi:plasmid stabilization system protein ParE
MKLEFTDAAEADVESIGDFIALSNPLRATSFIRELRAKCGDLIDMPLAFQLVRNHEASGIRRRVHGNYLIFYRVSDDAVEILRVLHGAMDYERRLFPDE